MTAASEFTIHCSEIFHLSSTRSHNGAQTALQALGTRAGGAQRRSQLALSQALLRALQEHQDTWQVDK